MLRSFFFLLLPVLALNACGNLGLGKRKPDGIEQKKSTYGPTGIPPQLRAKNSEEGTPVKAGGNAPAQQGASTFTPDDQLIFTDPDDPNAELPELTTLLASSKRGPWESSETVAKQRSIREGKPLLIWFAADEGSPMSKAISQELFSQRDFGQWADEKLIRLKVNSTISVKDPTLDGLDTISKELDIKSYVNTLKKRYKIMGTPSLIMLNPSGEVIGRYRGYKRGDADFTWGLLKQGEAAATTSHRAWQAELQKKGYREWQDRQQRKVFAKLTNYSKGTLNLIEPDGTRSQTSETKLSDTDRTWITEQKKLRNMQ